MRIKNPHFSLMLRRFGICLTLFGLLSLPACTHQAYSGPAQPDSDTAIVIPGSGIEIDGDESLFYSAISVLPGRHRAIKNWGETLKSDTTPDYNDSCRTKTIHTGREHRCLLMFNANAGGNYKVYIKGNRIESSSGEYEDCGVWDNTQTYYTPIAKEGCPSR